MWGLPRFPVCGGRGALLDSADRKATLLDDGANRLSSTSLATVGTAIAGVLKNSDTTNNRILKVAEVILTQNQLLRIAKRLRPNEKGEIRKVAASAVLNDGLDEISAGDFIYPVILKIIKETGLAGEIHGSAYYETDNKLLGVKEWTEEDLKRIVAEKLA